MPELTFWTTSRRELKWSVSADAAQIRVVKTRAKKVVEKDEVHILKIVLFESLAVVYAGGASTAWV